MTPDPKCQRCGHPFHGDLTCVYDGLRCTCAPAGAR